MTTKLCPRLPANQVSIVFLLDSYRDDPQEHIWVITLDATEPIPGIVSIDLVAKGGHNAVATTAAQLLHPVIKQGYARMILAHNHPIDSAQPTAEDIVMTHELKLLAGKMGIDLIDHVIVSRQETYSFAHDGGLL